MPLLGRKEKGELEEMILERLVAHWNANGADALVAETSRLWEREFGIRFEVVPGLSSGTAGPASAGIPLTHRGIW